MGEALEAATRHVEAFNAHDERAQVANETPDVEWVMPGGISLRGPEQVAGMLRIYWDAFPDVRVEPADRIEAGSTVITEGFFHGTQSGTLRTPQGDIPPSGNRINLRYVTVQRTKDGRIASEHLYFDQLDFLGQLGALPAPTAH